MIKKVRPNFNIQKGIPILIILRDMLKTAQNRKEAKKAIHSKHILLNNKAVKNEKNSAQLFDIITIIPSKKYYRLELSEKGKFQVEEIKENKADYKLAKVINKKTLKNKKIQLNLSDGGNFLSNLKCKIHDSVLINLLENKIETIIPLKEKTKTIILEGKHTGEMGVINKIKNRTAEVKIGNKNVEILINKLMAIEDGGK